LDSCLHLFERNEEVDRIAIALQSAASPHDALSLQVTLAWYLRQCDNPRACQLANAASAALSGQSNPHPDRQRLQSRLDLIRAETQWLLSDFDSAIRTAQAALAQFAAVGEHTGCADAQGILAAIYTTSGHLAQRDACLQAAVDSARQCGDMQRVDLFEAHQARHAALTNVQQSEGLWSQRFPDDTRAQHPCVSASILTYFAARAYNSGHFDRALQHLDQAFEAACGSGQLVSAVVIAVNAGNTYVVLNDHDAALEWLQRGLDLARPTGWATTLGPCLRQMGEMMRLMGRLESAQTLLDEAMQIYAPLRNSRNFGSVLTALGQLAQSRGDFSAALALFRQQAQRAQELAQADQLIEGRIGMAKALVQLDRSNEAEQELMAALCAARLQGAAILEVDSLRLLARIHSGRGDHPARLQYLEEAMATARQIDGYLLPGELLFNLAEAYAQAGRHAEAYQTAVLAANARERVRNLEASNRATAMQARLDTERSRAETEHHRRKAEAESRRAELLQQTSETLELLGTIGQEITSQLDQEHVFATIEQHVHGLLDAESFAIYLMDADGQGLTSVYDIEQGVRLPSDRVRLDDVHSFSARCVKERRELLVDFNGGAFAPAYVPGTLLTRSALFAPLTVAERVLGVMTIQSARAKAYAENDRLIFRTLCAYTAIALDNSVAYTHLRDAMDQLVVQEKLAALGALVAGVAHELNTPIGNCLLTASTLQEKTRVLETTAASGAMRRSTLSDYLETSRDGLELVTRGLRSAAELVQSFKQVAVDRATEQRRSFDLLRTSQEVIATLQRNIGVAGHRIEIDIAHGIVLDGYPGPYGQVLTNLVNNALLHAFGSKKGGSMHLLALPWRGSGIEIRFSDDGVGIAPENLKRIFDPFFTTKLGQGGSGLGMSISYNIVTSLFGGEFEVSSILGQGTCFTLRLPANAPQHAVDNPHIPTLRRPLRT
jgi:signal transduction histidine kinase/tetratricopeptide (TPR) repeat protein